MLTSVRSCTRCISRQRAGRWRRRRRSARYARALEKQERRKERALEKAKAKAKERAMEKTTERATGEERRRGRCTLEGGASLPCLSLPCAHASGLWH